MYYYDPNIEQAFKNEKLQVGYVAVHPEKGAFLGIDENKQPIFKNLDSLDPKQKIPTFWNAEYFDTQGTEDPVILQCHGYLVDVSDKEKQFALAGDIIREGRIQVTAKDLERKHVVANNNIATRGFQKASASLHGITETVGRLIHHFGRSSEPFNGTGYHGRIFEPAEQGALQTGNLNPYVVKTSKSTP